MQLVERTGPLAQLRSALVPGPGRFVLVSGEAGSGKTALLRSFLQGMTQDRYVLGHCDNLATARPLAPLQDWTQQPLSATTIREVLQSVDVAVVEDAHWADDATLDLLSLLARRPETWSGTVVLTYRPEGRDGPLGQLLGLVASQAPIRITLEPLTVEGISLLARGSGLDAVVLRERTGGNPFFVSECLAAETLEPSENVRDAVLSRLAGLPESVQAAVEAIAVVPGWCELWLAEQLGAAAEDLDEAVRSGLLEARADGIVALRHELAREAVERSLAPGRRRELNRRALAALLEPAVGQVSPARAVHHAIRAQDAEQVARLAVAAADVAESTGSRSQAAAQLELAIEHVRDDEQLQSLWTRLAVQRGLLARADAVEAYRAAIGLAQARGDRAGTARLLASSCAPLSMQGQMQAAADAVFEAVRLLEDQGPSKDLAFAYAQRCSHHMLARELQEAQIWGAKALTLATELHDTDTRVLACVQSGVAAWMGGDPAGLDLLREGVALAEQLQRPHQVVHGLSQIGSGGGEIKAYAQALPALRRAVELAQEHELWSRGLYAEAWLGRCLAETGAWDEAAQVLGRVVRAVDAETISRLTALAALGRLRARRGDPDVWPLLDEALALADRTGHLQRLWPVAAARAEAAWWAGALPAEVPLLLRVHALAARLSYPLAQEELALWLRRAGQDVASGDRTAFGAGDPEAWRLLGCPYEQALALADGSDDAQREALHLLTGLGAGPAVRWLTERRRVAGLSVPRGPLASTRSHPAGLTQREVEVLDQVAQGLTNAQIGEVLHISPKTVGHHVGNAMEKLGARTRAEAVALLGSGQR